MTTTGGTPTTTQVTTAAGTYEIEAVAESRVSSHWIRIPVDQAWSALPVVYQELGIPPGTVNLDARVFGNRDVRVNRRFAGERLSSFVDCGTNPIGAPVANTSSVHFDILTQLDGGDEGTEVRTQLQARAQPRGTSGDPVRCTSTGELEKHIAQMITERAGT